MKPIDADYGKTFLFPLALEDFIPEDHPARFIREFAEYALVDVTLDWKDGDYTGRPPYAGALLLRVWIYGYMHRITTVRKLEAACRNHVGLLWLTGMNAPDHNTLWRFWRANRNQIRALFRSSVELAVDAGMVGMVLHAVDGTKIQARASTRTVWSRRKLDKLLTRIDQEITQLESDIESFQQGADEGYRLPEKLTEKKQLRRTIEEKLQVLDAHGVDDLNSHDPEARLMKTGHGIRMAYNGQMVADAKETIIVAEDLVNEPFDQGQLMPMIDMVEANLGVAAAETVTDGGYNTEQTLVEADRLNRSVTLAAGPADAESHPDDPYHGSRFSYDAQQNVYTCPRGQQLASAGNKNKGHGRTVEIYRCPVTASCPVAAQCTNSASGRTIERTQHHEIIDRHRAKRRSAEGIANLKKRSVIGERPFAVIKTLGGFIRFRADGKQNAAAEWTWVCLAYNLKTLFKRWKHELSTVALPLNAAALTA